MARCARSALVIVLTSLALLACGGGGGEGHRSRDVGGPPSDAGSYFDSGAFDGAPILPVLGHWGWRRVCQDGVAINEVTVSAQPTSCGGALVAPYLRLRFDDTQPLAQLDELGQEQRMQVGGATLLAELCRAEGRCERAVSGWISAAASDAGQLRAVEVALDFAGASVRLRSPMFDLCQTSEPPGC